MDNFKISANKYIAIIHHIKILTIFYYERIHFEKVIRYLWNFF